MFTAACEGALKLYSRIAPTERGGYRLARLVRLSRPRERWRDAFRTPDDFSIDLDIAIYPDCCMAYGLYELDTARLIKYILNPGDHFVDAGANIGYFTLSAARFVGASGRVDAFEPQPQNLARLRTNLARNNLSDCVRVHPVALSDRAGEVQIYTAADDVDNHGTSSIFREAAWDASGRAVQSIAVRAERMDEMLAGTKPTLIKMDVEGAEPLVAGGVSGLLETSPQIILEFNPGKAAVAGFAPDEAVKRLLAAQPNYEIFAIDWRLKRVTIDDLSKLRQMNLLLRAR
jgi:FkbM family methyltransferase